MLKTKQLEHLVKLTLLTPYIKGERPVSILISARVESGKTELIRKAALGPKQGIIYLNDLTAYGLQTKYLDSIVNGKIRTIIIPDLITPLSRSPDTVKTLLAFLNSLIEEGVCEVQTFAKSIELKVPVRCNIITSIAREFGGDQRYQWTRIGFLSRVIPISYEYGPSSVYDIMQSIAAREYRNEDNFSSLKIPKADVEIELPNAIAQNVATLAPNIIDAGKFAQKLYGFRLQKQLQTLCMASALYNNRTTVQELDFEIVKQLGDFINFSYKQI